MLLGRPIPYEFESLMNYFHRLVKANYCENESWILELLQLGRQCKVNNVRFVTNNNLIQKFSSITGLDSEAIINMTIHRFSNGLWSLKQEKGCDFFLESQILPSTVRYCPLCLKEKYYERIYWQHDFELICTKHKVILSEDCSFCRRETTHKELIFGKCKQCGESFKNAAPIYCINQTFIENQEFINSILKINEENNTFNLLSDYSQVEYLKIIHLITKLYKSYIFNTTELDNEIYNFKTILTSWPINFYKFLDFVNNQIFNNNIQTYVLYNPIFCIIRIYAKLHRIEFLKDIIWEYFSSRINEGFLLNSFSENVIDKKYISKELASDIFKTSINNISKLFAIKTVENQDVINFEDILTLFYSFFKRGRIYEPKWINKRSEEKDDNGYNSLPLICKKLRKHNLSFYSILNVVQEYNIEVKIVQYKSGFPMFFLPEDLIINYFNN